MIFAVSNLFKLIHVEFDHNSKQQIIYLNFSKSFSLPHCHSVNLTLNQQRT